ncbi:unnamed protein product, partial [Mesorhabditis spiculigera]
MCFERYDLTGDEAADRCSDYIRFIDCASQQLAREYKNAGKLLDLAPGAMPTVQYLRASYALMAKHKMARCAPKIMHIIGGDFEKEILELPSEEKNY